MNPKFERFLAGRGVILKDEQKERFERYHSLIIEASKRLNLVSPGDLTRLEELHFADSLAPLKLIPNNARVADWGSGAGLPGIPIAIARPDIDVTLVESRQRKAAFLERARRELGLANLRVFPERGEMLEDCFDIVTVRAVGRIIEILEELILHLTEKGSILFYKGPALTQELAEAENLIRRHGLKAVEERVFLPAGEDRRYLVLSA